MIITKTPFRLSFFGGGTDLNSWYEKNGGLVISSAISYYTYISVRYLPPFFDHKTRLVYSKQENVNDNKEINHRGVRSCMEFLNIDDGVEIHHDADLPARSGIGSSSSFTVGMLKAFHALKNRTISKENLAKEAIYVEQEVAKENVGIQDQILASYGGIQILQMGPGKNYSVDPLIISPEYINHLESNLLLAFTGLTRFSTEVAAKQIENIEKGSIENKMSEIYDIAKESLTLLTEEGDLAKLGKLSHDTWEIKRTLSDSITNPEIDEIYSTAIRNGATGGRLLGAGGGGFFMFWAPPEYHQKIKDSLPQLKVWVPVKFDFGGSRVILH